MSLLEGLGGRAALQGIEMPPALREDRRSADADVVSARNRLEALRAADAGFVARQEAARSLEAAEARQAQVAQRVEREAKRAAALVVPEPAPLEDVRSSLRAGEALVVYCLGGHDVEAHFGVEGDGALALVSTRDASRVVALGPRRAIDDACAAFHVEKDADAADVAAAVARLQALVVEPLGLPSATRVLVAPDGPLHYVPFALLFPGREVAYAPSGSVLAWQRTEVLGAGTGVLALGDPDYGSERTNGVRGAHRERHGALARLPSSGAEAEAVGDVVLTGKQASESGLARALRGRERWRSVHLACHGFVDPERPLLSSLALAPAGDDDGFLTALEVLATKIPADLAVLSACQTGRGKIAKGEGLLGLSRSFLFAGAQRVLVSLWKVDDDATAALMARFYELWNPRAGAAGEPRGPAPLGAAAALRAAQEHVRSQEKWKHPYYWAAWVLWGLPE